MSKNNQNRTQNSLRNSKWHIIYKLIMFLFPFIIRNIIIKQLGIEYLGLSGLFTSVLSVLSLAELGFGTAIVYSLYKPVAEDNKELVCAILNYYKKIYRTVGITILVLGLSISPFLSHFIKGEVPSDINIYILYYIYLFNTVVSYFLFAYRGCIFHAFQRNDIGTKITILTKLFLYLVQLLLLIIFRNYYCYVIVIPLTTVLNNLITYFFSRRYFGEYTPKGMISPELKKSIKEQVKGILVERITSVMESSLDIIIISWLIGLRDVAMYNNYLTVMNGLIGILAVIPESVRNSIGNSIATESIEKNYKDFTKFNFIYMYICSICTVCLFCLYPDFITLWIGKEYLFSAIITILICIHFYTLKAGDFTAGYFGANGLWQHAKAAYIAEIIINLTLNIILGKLLGLTGIIISTILSLGLTNIFLIPRILFKKYFQKKLRNYLFPLAYYFLATVLITGLSYFILNKLSIPVTWLTFFVKGLILFISSAILLLLFFFKLPYFKDSKDFVILIVEKIFHLKSKKGNESK